MYLLFWDLAGNNVLRGIKNVSLMLGKHSTVKFSKKTILLQIWKDSWKY